MPASHRLPAQGVESAFVRIRAATLLVAALLGACAPKTIAEHRAGERIVTLVPSFADDCYAIGAGNDLVAVAAFTDDPRARRLPRVADATSVDAERIVALEPTLVLGIPSQTRLVEPLRRAKIPVVLLADDSYAAIFSNLRRIGSLVSRGRQADRLVAHLQRETAVLRAAATFPRRPRVFVVLDVAPIWTAGGNSYISTLIALAGGINAANDLHAAYGEYSPEALLRADPDLVLADRSTHLDAVRSREPWRSLRAIRSGRIYWVNPDLLQRPGPHYNEAISQLQARLRREF